MDYGLFYVNYSVVSINLTGHKCCNKTHLYLQFNRYLLVNIDHAILYAVGA